MLQVNEIYPTKETFHFDNILDLKTHFICRDDYYSVFQVKRPDDSVQRFVVSFVLGVAATYDITIAPKVVEKVASVSIIDFIMLYVDSQKDL